MKNISLALASLCVVFSAHADGGFRQKDQIQGQSQQSQAQQKDVGGNQQVLSFDELRQACLNPARFHNQIAPTNIQISCRDLQYKWVPDENGSLNMQTARHVTVSATSDKYKTKSVTGPVPCDPQSAACGRYKQVSEVVETIRPTTCEELIAFKGTAIDFCTQATNALRADNKEAIQMRETGQSIDLCGKAIASGK